MRARLPTSVLAAIAAATTVLAWPPTAATPSAKPAALGRSSERRNRLPEFVRRYMAPRTTSGAVTLVARHGRVAHFDAYGLMDLDARKPMQKDAIFRIASMTKPVVTVSLLMLAEEGKLRLTDSVSTFIPELS